MEISKIFKSFEKKDDYYIIDTNSAEIRIYFLSDDIVRVRASFTKEFVDRSYILTTTGWDDELDGFMGERRKKIKLISPTVNETNEKIVFTTKSIDVVLQKKPIAISVFDKSGTEIYSDLPGKAYLKDHLNRMYHYKKMDPNDHFYGFGEKTGDINKNGKYMRFSPKDNIGYNPKTGDPMYKHIPMYINLNSKTSKAVGVFYNNTFESAMSMGDEISGYWPRYCYYVADGGDLDYFIINGPKISKVIERYTDLTGKTVMQPKNSLGYIGSTMYYVELPENCDEEILGFIDKVHQEDIPIDSFMLSSGYTADDKGNRNMFTWNNKRFNDPKRFFSEMSKKGVSVAPNIKPGILKVNPNYSTLESKGCFIKTPDKKETMEARWWGGPGAYFDFTSPIGRKVWEDCLIEQIIENGTSAIWNDNCEYDGIEDREAVYDYDGKGGLHGELKCIQSTLMSYTSHTAIKRVDPDVRPYVICRSGSAGIQKYAQVWAGDNTTSFDALKYNIATVLGLGLSGVANVGTDIGGFQGPAPSAELLVRWVQNGIFHPRFSIHSCNNDNTVTEPWMYGEYTKYIREAIKFRYTMIPYLYSLLREANTKGVPIMRPVFYEFQDDLKCLNQGIDFMLGSNILVANIVDKEAKTRDIYLPKGVNWYDFYTRELFEGGQTITLNVDISSIPIFIKEGSITPFTNGLKCIQKEDIEKINYIIEPKYSCEFTLYEDDGKSNDYLNGDYLETHIKVEGKERVCINFSKTGNYDTKVKQITLDIINKEKGPYWVSVNGIQINRYLHRDKWENFDSGWYYSHTLKSVLVKYPEFKNNYEVIVSFEEFDLIGM